MRKEAIRMSIESLERLFEVEHIYAVEFIPKTRNVKFYYFVEGENDEGLEAPERPLKDSVINGFHMLSILKKDSLQIICREKEEINVKV